MQYKQRLLLVISVLFIFKWDNASFFVLDNKKYILIMLIVPDLELVCERLIPLIENGYD